MLPSVAISKLGEKKTMRLMGTTPSSVLFFFLASLRAQNVPRHVRAEVFAADSSVCGALDQGAAFSRNPAFAGLPLAQQRRRDSKLFGQLGLGAWLGSKVVGQVHGARV